MEGRDTTFRVMPDAQLKIFLTAKTDTRAEWRHTELMERGQDIGMDEVKTELTAQINAMEQEQTKVETFIQGQEGKFSLFGWLVKFFNR